MHDYDLTQLSSKDKRLGIAIIIGFIFSFITMSIMGYLVLSAIQSAEDYREFEARFSGFCIMVLVIIWNIIFWLILIYIAKNINLKSKSNIINNIGISLFVFLPVIAIVSGRLMRGLPLYSYGFLLILLGILSIYFYKDDEKDYNKQNYTNAKYLLIVGGLILLILILYRTPP